ncbi:hypothetical protein [Kiloniella sp. EL199]|uniref:hypothetical protein n=1 Tax=Kiloniella sp. EL199 TaxID=2107581 RepID=UPI000EA2A747|nr:hypothetical protein [Kiloniella sp. EL199]
MKPRHSRSDEQDVFLELNIFENTSVYVYFGIFWYFTGTSGTLFDKARNMTSVTMVTSEDIQNLLRYSFPDGFIGCCVASV